MAVEEAQYSILKQEEEIELRNYQSHIIAETIVNEAFEDAGNEAFERLFKYISGSNQQPQKVAMTSPVGLTSASQKIEMTAPVRQQSRDGKWSVSFMMPAGFTLNTTPEPLDSAISIRQIPQHRVAAIRYSGFWSEKNYQNNLAKLNHWIEINELRKVGDPIWARYNPPFMPWFLRRNEILIPVAGSSVQ